MNTGLKVKKMHEIIRPVVVFVYGVMAVAVLVAPSCFYFYAYVKFPVSAVHSGMWSAIGTLQAPVVAATWLYLLGGQLYMRANESQHSCQGPMNVIWEAASWWHLVIMFFLSVMFCYLCSWTIEGILAASA